MFLFAGACKHQYGARVAVLIKFTNFMINTFQNFKIMHFCEFHNFSYFFFFLSPSVKVFLVDSYVLKSWGKYCHSYSEWTGIAVLTVLWRAILPWNGPDGFMWGEAEVYRELAWSEGRSTGESCALLFPSARAPGELAFLTGGRLCCGSLNSERRSLARSVVCKTGLWSTRVPCYCFWVGLHPPCEQFSLVVLTENSLLSERESLSVVGQQQLLDETNF